MQLTWIKKVYLYLVSLISLVMLIIAGIILINLAIKTWVFPMADNDIYNVPEFTCTAPVVDGSPDKNYALPAECADPNWKQRQQEQNTKNRSSQKQRDASQALAMIIIAAPVFLYHWKLARKEV